MVASAAAGAGPAAPCCRRPCAPGCLHDGHLCVVYVVYVVSAAKERGEVEIARDDAAFIAQLKTDAHDHARSHTHP